MNITTFLKVYNQYGELLASKTVKGPVDELDRLAFFISHGAYKPKQLKSTQYPSGLILMKYKGVVNTF